MKNRDENNYSNSTKTEIKVFSIARGQYLYRTQNAVKD